MTSQWDRDVSGWIHRQQQVAFSLPVEYIPNGSKDLSSCRAVLLRTIEPIYKEAQECWLFGAKIKDDSFFGKGSEIRKSLEKCGGRWRIPYVQGLLTRYLEFFSNERPEERLLEDLRGTVVFVVDANCQPLKSCVLDLGEPEIIRNYATTMDRAGLNYSRSVIEADETKAVVCLPGRLGLDVLYVFSRRKNLASLLSLPEFIEGAP